MSLKFNPLIGDLEYQKKVTASGGGGSPSYPTYTRPSGWPALNPATNSFEGLLAINDSGDDTRIAFSVTCPSGTYTVNWGDGSTPTNHASGTVAYKAYTYSDPDLVATSYGYKIAKIIVTASTNITVTNFPIQHSSDATNAYRGYAWLDLDFNCASLNTLNIASPQFKMLEQIRIRNSAISSYNGLFQSLDSLKKLVELVSSASVTNANNMFNGCFSLLEVPLFNCSAITTASSMFTNCYSLPTIPAFNFSSMATTGASTMFAGCRSLEETPALNMGNITSTQAMFASCSALKTVGLFNTASVTNANNMFNGCTALEEMPALSFPSAITFSAMFYGCSSLKRVKMIGPSSATLTNMSSMFASCGSLLIIENSWVTSAVTDISNAFNGCLSLLEIPAFNFSAVTSFTSAFNSCFALTRIRAKMFDGTNPLPTSSTLALYNLGTNAINEIFTNLPAVTGTKNISIVYSRGKTGANTSIATGKGWTVAT